MSTPETPPPTQRDPTWADVDLAGRIGHLENRMDALGSRVDANSMQIGNLLTTDSHSSSLFAALVSKVDDIASKLTLDKSQREATHRTLVSFEAKVDALMTKDREREKRDDAVKTALLAAQATERVAREDQARRVVSYAKRIVAVLAALIIVMAPSAISTAPAGWHRYLYPALGMAAFAFIFIGIPAVIWEEKHRK